MVRQTNPYIWDASAATINSPIVTFDIATNGSDIVVEDTADPIVIELQLDPASLPEPMLIKPEVPDTQPMYYHKIEFALNGR